jgi:hypothetical protein
MREIIQERKKNLSERLENINEDTINPMMSAGGVTFDISGKISAIHCGGIGLVHGLVNTLRLPERINARLELLKRHKPYFESDHVMNIAYNIICGGENLEDIELLRNNEPYLDALGARRVPDPTTAGDFLRRFEEADVRELMDVINETTASVWEKTLGKKSRRCAILDVDGKIQETFGECKERMDIAYNGVWGFSTLALTEATTGAHLYVVNRPGNALSQEGAAEWMDKGIDVAMKVFKRVYLRGDSAFSLTKKFDEWDDRDVGFIFGYDATPNLVKIADGIGKNDWYRIERPQPVMKVKARKKKARVKKAAIIRRRYRTLTQKGEYCAEFSYRPTKCKKEYRVIALKKIIAVTEGQQRLFDDYRYFFYITNITHMPVVDALKLIRGRCNHENKIEQLDNGVHALKMPAAEFTANWAYMAICALAWNIKSWLGLFIKNDEKRAELITCEFKRFQNVLINIPCQILVTGRRLVYRFLNYNSWVEVIFRLWQEIKCFHFSFT